MIQRNDFLWTWTATWTVTVTRLYCLKIALNFNPNQKLSNNRNPEPKSADLKAVTNSNPNPNRYYSKTAIWTLTWTVMKMVRVTIRSPHTLFIQNLLCCKQRVIKIGKNEDICQKLKLKFQKHFKNVQTLNDLKLIENRWTVTRTEIIFEP